jgi:hypothetical protein
MLAGLAGSESIVEVASCCTDGVEGGCTLGAAANARSGTGFAVTPLAGSWDVAPRSPKISVAIAAATSVELATTPNVRVTRQSKQVHGSDVIASPLAPLISRSPHVVKLPASKLLVMSSEPRPSPLPAQDQPR